VFTRVLVATDFSEPAQAALEYGRDLARVYGAALLVLHVSDDIRWRYSLDMTPALLAGVQEDLEAGGRTRLDSLLTPADRTAGVVAEVRTSPVAADAIVEYGIEVKADLVVIGAHGRGGVSSLVFGSVAERVVRTAPCPVLTTRRPPPAI
jgi:universal stress protein A